MSKLVQSLSKALENCSNVDSDLILIQSWLSIFSQPENLTKALEENWQVNQEMIKTGVEFLQDDWSSGSYYNAGIDTAVVLQKSIGYPDFVLGSNDLMAVPDYVVGFLYGMTGDNHL